MTKVAKIRLLPSEKLFFWTRSLPALTHRATFRVATVSRRDLTMVARLRKAYLTAYAESGSRVNEEMDFFGEDAGNVADYVPAKEIDDHVSLRGAQN